MRAATAEDRDARSGTSAGPCLPRQVKLRAWLDRAVRVAAERGLDGRRLLDDPQTQQRLARAFIAVEVLRHRATARWASS